MNCSHAHEEIALVLVPDVKPSAQLQQHTQTCAQGLGRLEQQALEQWISAMQEVPVPRQSQVPAQGSNIYLLPIKP